MSHEKQINYIVNLKVFVFDEYLINVKSRIERILMNINSKKHYKMTNGGVNLTVIG